MIVRIIISSSIMIASATNRITPTLGSLTLFFFEVARSQSSGAGTMEDYSDFVDRSIPTDNELTPPSWHRDGPMPTISDSLFSLIILVYVSVIFIFMFFAFCWKEPEPPPPDPNAVKPPMITEILKLEEEEEALAKVTAAANELADRLQARRNGKKNGSLNGVEVNKRSVIEEEDDEDEEKLEMQEKPLINHGNGGEKEKRVSLNVGSPEKKILVDVINESKPAKGATVDPSASAGTTASSSTPRDFASSSGGTASTRV